MLCNVHIHIHLKKRSNVSTVFRITNAYTWTPRQRDPNSRQTKRHECTALIDSQYLQLYCIPTSSGIPEFPQSYMISEFHVRKRQCLGFFIRHCKAPTKKTRRRDLYSDWIWITGIKPERFQDTSSRIPFEGFSGFACPLELNHRCNSLS